MAFLTNHTQVLLCISREPGIRLREIGKSIGITERAAHRILAELVEDGYVSRERVGRRNHYTVHPDRPVDGQIDGGRKVGELLEFLQDSNTLPRFPRSAQKTRSGGS